MILEIRDLRASVDGSEIIKGLTLKIAQGEEHVLMGPNGSGKTTLAKAIFGHPAVKITGGDILVDGKSILGLSTDKRAQLGLFLGFQHPVEIDGVGFVNFLRTSREAIAGGQTDMKVLMHDIREYGQSLKMSDSIIGRSLNKGLSGGEKKKAEMLQLLMQKPKIAVLDEPDSGLDIDAIEVVATNISMAIRDSGAGVLIITHYNRILSHMDPKFVHVMVGGCIVAEGGKELISKLEKDGYESFVR